MVLPSHLTIGNDFSSAYGYKFLSLELDITPNRADTFSHIGVARDIAAVTKESYYINQIKFHTLRENLILKLN